MITVDELVKAPHKINRIGKNRRTACKGGCGRLVWSDYCRQCRRKLLLRARRAQRGKR